MPNRIRCIICDSDALLESITINNFPIFMGTTSNELSKDVFFDQKWLTCETCGTFQLGNLLELSDLYQNNHFEPIGATWLEHHKRFSEFVRESVAEDTRIVEVGGASGALAALVLEGGEGTREYTIVEPNYTGPTGEYKIIHDFVENHLDQIGIAGAVVHSHVLEHLYDPFQTLQSIVSHMMIGAKMVVSFPNLEELLSVGGSNALNFEHTYFLDKRGLIEVFEASGLEVQSIRDFGSHSFFICLVKRGHNKRLVNVSEFRKDASQLFEDAWKKIQRVASEFNQVLSSDPELSGYSFGAHVFSQGLFAMGMNQDSCLAILDNSKAKIGQRLYGTSLMVKEPEEISSVSKPLVALMASHYQDEIRSQLKSINPSVTIIE